MIDILGIVFGGVSRLAQHWMELRDKDKERDHEARMFDKQVMLQAQRIEADKDMRRMDADAKKEQGELQAFIDAINDQREQATAAGGWVLKISAAIRPLLTLYHAVAVYSAVKVALFVIAYQGGMTWATALLSIYGEWDRALCGSMVAFWFADRSLRKGQ